MKKVLIVDDSRYMRVLIREALEKGGYKVIGEAATGEEAIDLAFELEPDIITLDNILPDMVGSDILRVFREDAIQTKVILISGVGQEEVIKEGLDLGAVDYVTKPFTSEQIIEVLKKQETAS